MKVRFDVRHHLAAKEPSIAAGRVFGTFGLEAEQGERVYVEPFDLDVQPGQIVAFVGVSGSGKTSCLRQFQQQTGAADITDVNPAADKIVIEQLQEYGAETVEDALAVAGACGLAEAQLFLRYPTELSDGQQYRFCVAAALARGDKILVCDEFLATLDRVSAKVIAFNLRKLVSREGLILAVATTHEDLLEDLAPDYLVTFDGRQAKVVVGDPKGRKVRGPFRFTPISTLREALEPTGSASRVGITAGTALS